MDVRRRDRAFEAFGLALLIAALAVLALLLLNVGREGLGRLTWTFLTGYPSRRAANAGLLPALAGSVWLIALAVSSNCSRAPGGAAIPAAILIPSPARATRARRRACRC